LQSFGDPCSEVDLTPGKLVQAGESLFTPEEAETLQKLDGLLFDAFLESEEFALYSVLNTLLGAYEQLFTSTRDLFVHGTPQDVLVKSEIFRVKPGNKPLRTIPDNTVRMTRLYREQLAKNQWVVILIEAKRLAAVDKSLNGCAYFNAPCNSCY
jgi:hypothetical protein